MYFARHIITHAQCINDMVCVDFSSFESESNSDL